jgi:hypothetical protein
VKGVDDIGLKLWYISITTSKNGVDIIIDKSLKNI